MGRSLRPGAVDLGALPRAVRTGYPARGGSACAGLGRRGGPRHGDPSFPPAPTQAEPSGPLQPGPQQRGPPPRLPALPYPPAARESPLPGELSLAQQVSKRGPRASSTSWKPDRNARSQAPPRPAGSEPGAEPALWGFLHTLGFEKSAPHKSDQLSPPSALPVGSQPGGDMQDT